ncbi:MAG: hypothetical protein AAF998_10590, partial [Bacteroidota bacterium]
NKESAMDWGKNALMAFGGMTLGAVLVPGRVSLPAGVILALYGIHKQSASLVSIGTGLALAMPARAAATGDPNLRQAQPPNGGKFDFETYKAGVSGRAKMFFSEFGKKLFLDKIGLFSKKDATTSDQGGDAGPDSDLGYLGANPFATLDQMNNSLIASSMDFREQSALPLPGVVDADFDLEDEDDEDLEGFGAIDTDFEDVDEDLDAFVDQDGELVGFDQM